MPVMEKVQGKKSPFNVELNISEQSVCGLLVNAFDGWSGGWAECVEVSMPERPDWSWCSQEERREWEEVRRLYTAPMCGGHISLEDMDTGRVMKITKELMIEGLKIMAKKYPNHFYDFLSGNDDAITGDIFVQCCCFRQVIYG